MGTPACRISDTTAHGGVVILGFPQVLIGNLPASRITDMHTCPMVTGVVPHVGGPFILGSPTVIVGMMPQSRVGDQLICVGPPDVAILGELTVLVGMAGAGGAGGAMGGVGAMGVPVPSVPPAAPPAATGGASAEQQKDGTVKTATSTGEGLPPVELKQDGWPNLPPEDTASFQSVQPATIAPGTTLYAPADADASGSNSYWSTEPPSNLPSVSGGSGEAGATNEHDWNPGTHVLVHVVPPGGGLKAWAGKGVGDPKLQIWTPPGALAAAGTQRFRQPGTVR